MVSGRNHARITLQHLGKYRLQKGMKTDISKSKIHTGLKNAALPRSGSIYRHLPGKDNGPWAASLLAAPEIAGGYRRCMRDKG